MIQLPITAEQVEYLYKLLEKRAIALDPLVTQDDEDEELKIVEELLYAIDTINEEKVT